MSALARWDAFLAQIQGRHAQVRADAEAEGRAFIATVAGGGDYLPLSHQLGAVKHRLQDLERKIMDTWHAQVDDAILAEGNPVAVRDAACAKGIAIGHALEDARDEFEIGLMAELARARYAAAQAALRPIVCAGCGATYQPPHAFRLIEMACACGATVRYDPDELMRSAGAIGTHPIAQQAAVAEWRAMVAADRARRAARSPAPLHLIQADEAAQIAYWYRYLAARAWFEPELGRDPAMEVQKRMEQWYQYTADHEPAWVEAGRPRAV
ncbi:MAG: hypothetical protein JNK64_23365 [Myxococcales bacterium]|nr:hypothetical protein [Myxococcales bacterium]